jgi:hypothetical protein
MIPYLGLFGYLAAAAMFNALRPVRLHRGQLWITAFILIVLIGFRWHVGADWDAYVNLLQYAGMSQSVNLNVGAEPAYALLNSIAALEDWDLWFPNLVCAMIFTYGLLAFCRQQPNPWLALVVACPYLIICVAMGYTRQSAALGLVLLAFVQFARRSQVQMFITLGLATTFHASAIVLPPLFGMAIVRRAFITGVILAIFGIALYFGFSERISLRMTAYETTRYVPVGAMPRLLMSVIPAIIFLLSPGRFTTDPEEHRLWTLVSLVAVLTIPMLYLVSSKTIVDRLGIYLAPLQIFVLGRAPLVFGRNRKQNFVLVVAIILYSFAAEVVWLNFGAEARAWIPYRNYLWQASLSPST